MFLTFHVRINPDKSESEILKKEKKHTNTKNKYEQITL